MSAGKKKDDPKTHINIRLGAMLPMLDEYAQIVKDSRIVPPNRSVLVREILEVGLMVMIEKLSPAQKARVLKARPAV